MRHGFVWLMCGLWGAAVPALAAPDPAWSIPADVDSQSGNATGAVGETIAVDSSGTVHILQNDRGGGDWITIASSDDDGASWSVDPVDAAGPGAIAGTIAIANDRIHVVWSSMVDNEIHYAWQDLGGAWSAASTLSSSPTDPVDSPQVTVDASGQVHVFWHEGDATGSDPVVVLYRRSVDTGATWGSPQQLSPSGLISAWPRTDLSAASGTRVAVAWRAETAGGWRIVVAISEDGGDVWTTSTPLTEPGDQWDPQTLVDPDGVVHLGIMRYPGGVHLSEPTVEYTRSTDGITWDAVQSMSDERSRFPHLLYDTFSGTLWFGNKDDRDYLNPIITRTDLAMKYSLDDGATWASEEMATDFGSDRLRVHGYTTGPEGGVHVVVDWTDLAGTVVVPKYLQRKPMCHQWLTGPTAAGAWHLNDNFDDCSW
jgi:hypothetical protein